MADICFLERDKGEKLAYRRTHGAGSGVPGVFWVGGFRSDMEGTKAACVCDWAEKNGLASARFDYFGHGRSSGAFADGTIGRWRDDAFAAFDALTEGPQIVLGSSMGGWISNLLVRARSGRIAAVVWLAPAPDFTEDLMWDLLPDAAKAEILQKGSWDYDEDGDVYPITRALIQSGRENLVLDKPLNARFPVRILHGMADRSVPWQRSLKLVEGIEGDVRVSFLKNSDHRLSSPSDLKLLTRTLDALLADFRA